MLQTQSPLRVSCCFLSSAIDPQVIDVNTLRPYPPKCRLRQLQMVNNHAISSTRSSELDMWNWPSAVDMRSFDIFIVIAEAAAPESKPGAPERKESAVWQAVLVALDRTHAPTLTLRDALQALQCDPERQHQSPHLAEILTAFTEVTTTKPLSAAIDLDRAIAVIGRDVAVMPDVRAAADAPWNNCLFEAVADQLYTMLKQNRNNQYSRDAVCTVQS
mgnify:CR=1 FL=1